MKKVIAILIVVACMLLPLTALSINTDITVYEYYKQQLNSDEKIIYQAIHNALKQDNFNEIAVTGISLSTKREDLTSRFFALNGDYGTNNEKIYDLFDEDDKYAKYVQNALDAFVLDHTEYYWFNVEGTTHGVGVKISRNAKKVVFTLNYTIQVGKENYNYQSDYPAIMQKIASITSKSASRFEQVKAIHDYICQNTTYIETTAAHDASGVFVGGKAVCQGYATAFKMACDYYSIPCVCVSGVGNGANGYEDHMWNYVQMENGVWYAVDVTWDDQNKTIYNYFLCGSENAGIGGQKVFFADHKEENLLTQVSTNKLVYPQISKNAYFVGNSETPVPTKAPVATPIVTPEPTPTPIITPNNGGGEQNDSQGGQELPDISINANNNQNVGGQDKPQKTNEATNGATDQATREVGGTDVPENIKEKINLTPVFIGVGAAVVIAVVVIIITFRSKNKQ